MWFESGWQLSHRADGLGASHVWRRQALRSLSIFFALKDSKNKVKTKIPM
jgi:hypothetical protein